MTYRSRAPVDQLRDSPIATTRRFGLALAAHGRKRRFVRRSPLPAAMLGTLLLAACKLIDQTTFAPAPEAKAGTQAAAQPAPALQIDPRRPLVTIDYIIPDPAYREMLGYAVRAAERRDKAVQFDVVAVVKDAADAAQGQTDAAAVMRAIIADGVPESRIHLALRADPAVPNRQVRVYVR